MSTNPVLVPIRLVSQFLATEKIDSRYWLQRQMEFLLDEVFDRLSAKFGDYVLSNAISVNTEYPVAVGQSQNRDQMMNGQVNLNRIHSEALVFDQTHSLSFSNANLEQSNQYNKQGKYGLEGNNDQPLTIENDDASRIDRDEIGIKDEIDDTDSEIIITNQNSQIAQPVIASTSNENSNHNWTNENDDEYNLDGALDDEQSNGLEHVDIEDDAQMNSDEVEVTEQINDTNNQLTKELQQNVPLSDLISNDVRTNGNDDDDDQQQQNKHLRDDNDEINEHYEERSRPRKKQKIDKTQQNNTRVTRQSSRLANRNQTDQEQHINDQTEPIDEAEETNEVNNQDKQIILTLSLKCLEKDCTLTFNNKTQLNVHMSTQHNILPHRCLFKDCKQSFSNKKDLRQHTKQVHAHITQWHCDKCPKLIHTNENLSKHNYLYHQLGQYQCAFPNCTLTGDHRKKIYNHYSVQHKTVEFTCHHPNCGRRFNNKSNFKIHQQTHLGIKPYRCKWPSCGYGATQATHTIAHIRRNHLKQGSTETSLVDPREYLEVIR